MSADLWFSLGLATGTCFGVLLMGALNACRVDDDDAEHWARRALAVPPKPIAPIAPIAHAAGEFPRPYSCRLNPPWNRSAVSIDQEGAACWHTLSELVPKVIEVSE